MDELRVTDRTRLRRKADRGHFDRTTIDAILDEGFVCHLGLAEGNRPWAVPMVYGRVDDAVFVHGAAGNASLSALAAGAEVCLTVTLVDGIVLSRSLFHTSINYRTVMLFGRPVKLEAPREKRAALEAIVDHVVPGRRHEARGLTDREILATQVLRLDIREGSAKVRTGGPAEEPEDLELGFWGGQIPFKTEPGPPVPDEWVRPGVPPPRVPPRRRPA
jgi:nitroimidazol reductase NimA-like FMN-containing flavoprotein (pyridoxamine 5'-phosphate oxidase superfamily)